MLIEIFEALGVRDKISALQQIKTLQDAARNTQCFKSVNILSEEKEKI